MKTTETRFKERINNEDLITAIYFSTKNATVSFDMASDRIEIEWKKAATYEDLVKLKKEHEVDIDLLKITARDIKVKNKVAYLKLENEFDKHISKLRKEVKDKIENIQKKKKN